MTLIVLKGQSPARYKGGPNSGNHGHEGRPGKVGGSLSRKTTSTTKPDNDELEFAWNSTATWDQERKNIARNAIDDMMSKKGGYGGLLQYDDDGFLSAVLSYKLLDDKVVVNNFATRYSGGKELLQKFRLDIGLPLEFHATSSARDYYNRLGLELVDGTTNVYVYKGGPGSGFRGHAGRIGQVGGSSPQSANYLPKAERVWQGKQAEGKLQFNQNETGRRGEQLAAKALQEKFGTEFSLMNVGLNNAPIDVAGDHHAIEVKTGPATNSRSAQQWRITTSYTSGPTEQALIAKMTPAQRSEYNVYKQQQSMARKMSAVARMSELAGTEIKPATVGVILSADGTRGDVYFVPGFHLRLGWGSYATDEYYIGTYEVDL